MAILSAENSSFAISYDTELLIPSVETQGTLSTPIHTATQNREIQKNYVDDWFGSGFVYNGPDENGLWYPESGTVNGFSVSTKTGDVLVSLSGCSVSVSSLNSISPPTSPTAPGEDVQLNMILFAGDDELKGSRFGDTLAGFGGNDLIDGGEGVDKAVYFGGRSLYAISQSNTDWKVAGGDDGVDTLTNIERLQFSDESLALDIDGAAGKVAKILASVFGASAVSNKGYAGIGLKLMDGGMSYEALAALAIDAAGAHTRETVVDLLWTNLMGSHPTAEQAKPFVDMLATDLSNVGSLGVIAADYAATIGVVNLSALSMSGLEYI